MAIHHGAGVTKKSTKKAPLSSKKRRRHEKGMERAELVMDKLEKKIAKSMGKGKSGKGRRVRGHAPRAPMFMSLSANVDVRLLGMS